MPIVGSATQQSRSRLEQQMSFFSQFAYFAFIVTISERGFSAQFLC